MADLPVVGGLEAARVFERAGWVFNRQVGSHMVYKKLGVRSSLSVPKHKTLDRGLLRRLIRDSGPTVDEFVELL
jgi:predicted RNA binding protein YcfA (HicA-like mRNA interferase family)